MPFSSKTMDEKSVYVTHPKTANMLIECVKTGDKVKVWIHYGTINKYFFPQDDESFMHIFSLEEFDKWKKMFTCNTPKKTLEMTDWKAVVKKMQKKRKSAKIASKS